MGTVHGAGGQDLRRSGAYRVSRDPQRAWRWWSPLAQIPDTDTDIRLATLDEAALMEQIEFSRNPSPNWGRRIADMMAEFAQRNGIA